MAMTTLTAAEERTHFHTCPICEATCGLEVRTPLIKRDGRFVPASWDEAFAEIDRRLTPILQANGRDAVGVYLGNPGAHNLALMLYSPVMLRALASRNIYSASTVDQMPKQV